jgi:hypothetical protein
LQYKSYGPTDRVHTVGIQNAAGTVAVQAAYNPASNFIPTGAASNFAVDFTPPPAVPSWLGLSASSGTTPGTGTSQLDLSFNAASLAAGTYSATLHITSNDANESSLAVPVSLTVGAFAVVPNAPGGLAATAVAPDQVGLSWTPEGGSPTGHRADYRVQGAGTWTSGPVFGAADTTGTVSGLLPSTAYEFQVVASNASGDSTASNTATATTHAENFTWWIGTQSGVNGQTGANQDPDADGATNLIEYALGTEPGDTASHAIPQFASDASGHLTLAFTPQRVSGLSFHIEASPDLSDWSNTTEITGLLTPGTPFTHTDGIAFADRRFLRLCVVENP